MRIYVASKFEEAPRVRSVMTSLRLAGHTITFDWTHGEQLSAEQANLDVQGVLDAEALVFIAEIPLRYCGALVEFGLALGRGIPIYVMGHCIDQCIFMQLPQVHRGIEDLLKH